MIRHSKGFTIVELLIVIVVIGVLASLSITAYSGIQQRATNAELLSTYQAVHKTLNARLVSDGYFAITPIAPGEALPCIGETTDRDSDGSKDCIVEDGVGSVHADALFDTGMSTVTKKMPGKHNPVNVTAGGGEQITIYNPHFIVFADMAPEQDPGDKAVLNTGQKIAYIFEGLLLGEDQKCGSNSVRPVSQSGAVSPITYTFAYAENAFGGIGFWNNTTACYYAVLAP